MMDPWIEDDNSEVVLIVQTKEQLKRIEERRLIEESDFAITKTLFQDDKNQLEENTFVDKKNKQKIKAIEKNEKNEYVNKKS